MRILLCIGTRPEAIKMLPLALELRASEAFEVLICHSGQHGKKADEVFEFFKIEPDFCFSAMRDGQSLTELTERLLDYFDMLFKSEKIDLVLVHGDTTTAFCASLVAFYNGIRVGHVEAGLRTFNNHSPFPEEFNRVSIDAMADYLFAPTILSARNLEKEGRKPVFTVGNTVIDSFKYTLKDTYNSELLEMAQGRKIILLTSHRRENLGERMRSSFLGVKDVLVKREDLFCIFPMHPNPYVRREANEVFDNVKNIKICDPLPIFDFHNLLSRSLAVMTDSGGVQEESAYLGVPVFVLRDHTERCEGVESGNVLLVGTQRERAASQILDVLDDDSRLSSMSKPSLVFGDGHASERIASVLMGL